MQPQYEELISRLHLEINEHLSSLHVLHHKQQIANIHLISSQILRRLKNKQCDALLSEVELLHTKIERNFDTSNINDIIKSFSMFLQNVTDEMDCSEVVTELKTHISSYLSLISNETTSFQEHIQFTDLSNIDTVKVYKNIIDPLSNQKRLDILLAIHNHKRRFKDLEDALDLQAGHLIYHLNPLKEGGYVTQDTQKNYLLTDKGSSILEAINHIYEKYIDH